MCTNDFGKHTHSTAAYKISLCNTHSVFFLSFPFSLGSIKKCSAIENTTTKDIGVWARQWQPLIRNNQIIFHTTSTFFSLSGLYIFRGHLHTQTHTGRGAEKAAAVWLFGLYPGLKRKLREKTNCFHFECGWLWFVDSFGRSVVRSLLNTWKHFFYVFFHVTNNWNSISINTVLNFTICCLT